MALEMRRRTITLLGCLVESEREEVIVEKQEVDKGVIDGIEEEDVRMMNGRGKKLAR